MSNKMFTRLRRDTATSVPPNCLHPIVDDRPVEDLGSYHDSIEAVKSANEQAHRSDATLAAIQIGISDLKRVVSPSAGSNPEVLAAAVAKLRDQQTSIDSLQQRVEAMKRAGRLDSHLYQGGKDEAVVGQFSFDQNTGTIAFSMLTSQQPFDFGKEIEFQKARISCEKKDPTTSAVMGANMNLTYYRVMCHWIGPIQ